MAVHFSNNSHNFANLPNSLFLLPIYYRLELIGASILACLGKVIHTHSNTIAPVSQENKYLYINMLHLFKRIE